MSRQAGVWIDHQRAVIVSVSDGHVTTETLESGVGAHPRFSGEQVGGGEKKYEQQYAQHLDRYYGEVISHLGAPEGLLILGPGEAKLQLAERLSRSTARPAPSVEVEAADKLSDIEIVAKVKAHFGIGR